MTYLLVLLFLFSSFSTWGAELDGGQLTPVTEAAEVAFTSGEPSIASLHAAALRYAGLDDNQVGKWQKGLKKAAWLPRLQLGFNQKLQDYDKFSIDDSISVTSTGVTIGPPSNKFDQYVNQSISVDLKAYWYLDRLAFDRNSLAISYERRQMQLERAKLLEKVNMLYFKRQLLKEEMAKEKIKAQVRTVKSRELAETTAHLDALTGEWFSMKVRGELP